MKQQGFPEVQAEKRIRQPQGEPRTGQVLHELAGEVAGEVRRLQQEAREKESRGQAEITCTIPKELLEDFIKRVCALYYPGGLSQAVSDMMNKALLERGPKPEHPFADGVKFYIPRSDFILFTLPESEHKKLVEWKKIQDRIEVAPGSRCEVLLMNETRRERAYLRR
jgi:hypothetical protein